MIEGTPDSSKRVSCRVRHEAGEALGAIGNSDCIAHLERHQQDACLEVSHCKGLFLFCGGVTTEQLDGGESKLGFETLGQEVRCLLRFASLPQRHIEEMSSQLGSH